MARSSRQLSLTAELVASVDRKEPDSGPEFGLIELVDDEYELAAHQILSQTPASFSLDIVRWRATPQQPGLMMALDYGGSCHGVAFRLPAGDGHAQLRLLRREANYKEDLPSIRWIGVQAATGNYVH